MSLYVFITIPYTKSGLLTPQHIHQPWVFLLTQPPLRGKPCICGCDVIFIDEETGVLTIKTKSGERLKLNEVRVGVVL
jgi:hypothetical protein